MIRLIKVFHRYPCQLRTSAPITTIRFSSSTLVPAYINGNILTDPRQTFVVNSPWNNTELHRAHNATVEHALAAAEAAGTAGMSTWGNYAPAQRRDVLLRAAEVSDT